MIETPPIPEMGDGAEAPFWEALKHGRLDVQHCRTCNSWLFPIRVRCGGCGAQPAWRTVSGRGRIWSFTRVYPPVLPAFAPFAPYPVVLVELDEQPGLRLVGNLVEQADDPINGVEADRISIGAPVEMLVRDLGGTPWPAWRLTEPAR